MPLLASLLIAAALAPLPDPLRSTSGQIVTDAAQWRARRAELAEIIQTEGLGHLPPAPGNVRAETLKSSSVLGGTVDYRLIRLSFGPDRALHLDVALFVPPAVWAVVLHPSFLGTPGDQLPAHPDNKFKPSDPEDFAAARRDVLSRGYALLTFYYQQGAADGKTARQSGFYAGFPDTDAGTLAMWAWGISRCVDFLETQHLGPIVLVGHSRLGKTALVAGAFDERIAVVVPAGSGCGGTGAYRVSGKARLGKEGLEEATAHFPWWFNSRLPTYAGRVDQLPYDANELLALVAPRALLDTEGYADPSANGKAAAASYRGVLPVYHLLDADDRVGINFRPGGHALTDDDWQAILDFSDHQLKGTPYHRPFHSVPDDSLLK